uniref:Uncharacterized protein n=1 Tax=Caenorhabditis japonica TaxID=281687 RepID=A0A8R1IA40_CAEJA
MKIQFAFGLGNSGTRTFPLTMLSALGCLYGGLNNGVHHWKLLDEGETITAEYYSAQLRKNRWQTVVDKEGKYY